jgi:hypothetical protein
MPGEVTALNSEDPIIFAHCPNCNKRGRGVKVGNYYSKAFTERRWRKGQNCENCDTPLVVVFVVDTT